MAPALALKPQKQIKISTSFAFIMLRVLFFFQKNITGKGFLFDNLLFFLLKNVVTFLSQIFTRFLFVHLFLYKFYFKYPFALQIVSLLPAAAATARGQATDILSKSHKVKKT
jgi:hypothetical protein